jgi:predicted RNA-binding protein with EMAP domain
MEARRGGLRRRIPAAASIANAKDRRDNIEAFVSYVPPDNFYGVVEFVLALKYNEASRQQTRQPDIQYIYQFD